MRMMEDGEMRRQIEQKAIIEDVVSGIVKLFDTVRFRILISKFINDRYKKALEKQEVKFNMNFFSDEKDLENLRKYAFESVANVTDDVGRSLRGELQRGIIAKENVKQLKVRIKTVFSDPKYTNRLKTTIRTEGVRAGNSASFNAALQSGRDLNKFVLIVRDQFTSDICKAEDRKYGSPEKSIPLNKQFVVVVGNKTYRENFPPFHPNCRTAIEFVEKGREEEAQLIDRHKEVEEWAEETGIGSEWRKLQEAML